MSGHESNLMNANIFKSFIFKHLVVNINRLILLHLVNSDKFLVLTILFGIVW